MALNKEWHLQHPMPANATLDERIAWHIEHEKNCMCREMPDKIREEIKKRKKKIANLEPKRKIVSNGIHLKLPTFSLLSPHNQQYGFNYTHCIGCMHW